MFSGKYKESPHAKTKRREYAPGDGLNMKDRTKHTFEDKPFHKQKQSNHEVGHDGNFQYVN